MLDEPGTVYQVDVVHSVESHLKKLADDFMKKFLRSLQPSFEVHVETQSLRVLDHVTKCLSLFDFPWRSALHAGCGEAVQTTWQLNGNISRFKLANLKYACDCRIIYIVSVIIDLQPQLAGSRREYSRTPRNAPLLHLHTKQKKDVKKECID
jgi:hypothetical protein